MEFWVGWDSHSRRVSSESPYKFGNGLISCDRISDLFNELHSVLIMPDLIELIVGFPMKFDHEEAEQVHYNARAKRQPPFVRLESRK